MGGGELRKEGKEREGGREGGRDIRREERREGRRREGEGEEGRKD